MVSRLHPSRNAHRRATIQRSQRVRPDEQNRRSARHATVINARTRLEIEALLRSHAGRHMAGEEDKGGQEIQSARHSSPSRHPRLGHRRPAVATPQRARPHVRRLCQIRGHYRAHVGLRPQGATASPRRASASLLQAT